MNEINNHDDVSKNQEDFNSEYFINFVGKNYGYYNRKWGKINIKNPLSLNWIAILFGPVWYAYRKMYLYLFAFYGGLIVVDMLFSYVFQIELSQAPFTVAAVMIGLYANGLYLYFIRRKIHKIKNEEQDQDKINERLKKTGGASMVSAVIAGAIMALGTVFYIINFMNELNKF